jgi:hypothetical protein
MSLRHLSRCANSLGTPIHLARSSCNPSGRAGTWWPQQGTSFHRRSRSRLSSHRRSLLGTGCKKSSLLLRTDRLGSRQHLPSSSKSICSQQDKSSSLRPLQRTSLLSYTSSPSWWCRNGQPGTSRMSRSPSWSRRDQRGTQRRPGTEMERTSPRWLLRKSPNQPQRTACCRPTKSRRFLHSTHSSRTLQLDRAGTAWSLQMGQSHPAPRTP